MLKGSLAATFENDVEEWTSSLLTGETLTGKFWINIISLIYFDKFSHWELFGKFWILFITWLIVNILVHKKTPHNSQYISRWSVLFYNLKKKLQASFGFSSSRSQTSVRSASISMIPHHQVLILIYFLDSSSKISMNRFYDFF